MKPKYEIGQRVMVRGTSNDTDDGQITERLFAPKGAIPISPEGKRASELTSDVWIYRIDSNEISTWSGEQVWTFEQYIYPLHDGGDEYSGITEFMDSLNKPQKVIA